MITHLTIRVAEAICSGEKVSLETFFRFGKANEFFMFAHHNFFYSYPEWEKKWKDEQICEFHQVNIACNCCGRIPERNYGGIGNIWLMKSNRERRDFVCFCNSCKNWRTTSQFKFNQPIQMLLPL